MFWKRRLDKEGKHEVVDILERKEQPLTKVELTIIEEQEERRKIEEYNKKVANDSRVDGERVVEGINDINYKLNSDVSWHRELVNRFLEPLYYAVVTGKTYRDRERKFTRAELDEIAKHFTQKGFKVRIVPEDSWYHEHVEVFIRWHEY